MKSRLLILSAVALSACSSNPFSQMSRSTNFAANYASDTNSVASGLRAQGIGDLRQKIEAALVDAQVTTQHAASALSSALEAGDAEKIDVATKELVDAKEEEESITDALENVVEVIETGDDDGSDDDSPSLTVADLDAAEKATEAAEATLQSYRDKGYGQMDIDEALGAIDVASATEERIRQELKDAEENKLTNNDKPEDISTDEEMPEVDLIATLDAAEKVTDAAREAVEEVKAKGYGQMDIDEANAAFEAAEAEEDKAREAAKAAEKSDPEPSDDTVTEIEDVTVTEDVAGEETDVTATDDGGDTDTGTTGETEGTDDQDESA